MYAAYTRPTYGPSCYNCGPSIDSIVQDHRGLPATVYFNMGMQPQEYKGSPTFSSAYFERSYLTMMANSFMHYHSSQLEYHLQREIIKRQVSSAYLANTTYTSLSSYTTITPQFVHEPTVFLAPQRPKARLIDSMDTTVRSAVEKTFRLLLKKPLHNIAMAVLDHRSFKDTHSSFSKHWSPGIVGFAINRIHLYDISQIFIKAAPLDALMMTIGHEIGHCLSTPLDDPVMEEAKAFAFELAWMQTIHEWNILGLRNHMNMDLLRPAHNGLHDRALEWVRSQLDRKHPLDVFRNLSKKK